MQTFLRRTFRPLRPFLLLGAVLLAFGAVLGFLAVGSLPETTTELRREVFAFFGMAKDWPRPGLFLFVALNNSIKTLVMMFLGLLFGIVPASFLVINGLVLQVVATHGTGEVGGLVVAAGLLPHGVIEISALILGAAVGLRLGLNLFRRLRGQSNRLAASLAEAWRIYARIVLPMLVVAAAIEVWVTPTMIRLALD